MRGMVITAVAYPLILAVFAVLVVAALMMFVVPKVVEQFDTMGQTLPLLTRIVMGLSQFLAGWWWALLLGIGVLAGLGWRALREEPIRYAADHRRVQRSEEHTSELQSLMRISYAVFCLNKKKLLKTLMIYC